MDKLPRIPSPPGTLWREFRVGLFPIVIFVLVLIVAIITWHGYVAPAALVGEVEAVRASVASPQTGRVVQLSVHLMERVSKGQVLGQVAIGDPRVIEASIALSRSRLALIRSSPAAEIRLDNSRVEYEHLRLDWLQQHLQLATAKSKLPFYEAQYQRIDQLFGSGQSNVVSALQLDIAKRDLEALRTEIAEATKMDREAELSIASFKPPDVSPAGAGEPESVRAALAVEERNLELLQAQLAPQPLVSPIDGVVSAILHHEGDGVPAGQPVLTVSGVGAERIVAYLRQPLNYQARTNLPIEIRSRSFRRDIAVGQILAVGTQLEAVLPELLPIKPVNGAPAEFGLPILVSVPKGFRVLPGEIVDLRPMTD